MSEPARAPLPRPVLVWLAVVIAMIAVMVVLGGVTRLTQSGLSMVDWRPIMGIVPPMTDAEWRAAFEAYKRFPEYRELTFGMTLAEFKSIYLMEYAHRVWGRAIGLAYALPFAWFVVAGLVRGRRVWHLAGVLALGAGQGLLGWVMVQSGLIDVPSVSPYRLTAHLGLALLIAGILLWIVLTEVTGTPGASAGAARRLSGHVRLTFMLVVLTVLSGGFVAGLDAGLTYNTFPLMDGRLVPHGMLDLTPAWRNAFENVAMVQFDHRWLGVITATVALALWWRAQALALGPRARRAVHLLGAMALIQPALGIATLLLVVPIGLAALHQAGAVTLLGAVIWVLAETRAETRADRGSGGPPPR